MDYKTYIKDGIKVSRLGFGAWPLGNIHQGVAMTVNEGVELVRTAFRHGINFFDTAPNYASGQSEIILGIALKDIREQVVINTKFGHSENDVSDFSETSIRLSIEKSLKKLQTHYLDSILLHNPSFNILEGKTNHFNVLEDLRKEGLIKGYGVSIDTKDELEATLKLNNIHVIELLYNVFFQSTRSMLDQIKDKNIALIIKVPLDSGWLTGSYHQNSKFLGVKARWTKEDKLRRFDLVTQLKDLIGSYSINDCALGFLFSYDAITTVIPGMRNIDQLKDHLKAYQFDFPKHLKKSFELFYDQHIKDNPLPW
jgi:aryl-alcohol dehydrogenase-like predicted oxidoreductase